MKSFRSKKIFFFFLTVCGSYGVIAQQQAATVKEYKKAFKTYAFSDPDPIAKAGSIYPYYRFDGYTDSGINKEWNVVELENDFIRIMILPEIGGKIWGAWEKSTGKPFIYYNQVVKFRDVAMRGPWTSGGIEANYGIIGHTPNCATPMDYKTEKKADGSVSCYIGTLDLLTQTYWTIEINLPSGAGYFTTHSFWNNSTSLEQSYYTWMNTGMKADGNLEFIYPGTRYIGHAGEYADWKINADNGKNISFYNENNFGGYKSYHVFGKYTDFFGAYYHRDNLGMARFSDHDEKPGKKIWIWGLSQQGMIWEKLLSDTDGQYVEVQSGRLFNQAAAQSTFTPFKHTGFAPTSSDTWTEYWFPVMNIKGFVKANALGALNLRVEGGYLKIGFSPVQDISDELIVMQGETKLYSKALSLKPLKVFSDSIPFTGDANNLVATLGNTKFRYSSDPKDGVLSRPVDLPADFDWNSVQGLYIQGIENIYQRFYVPAEENLKSCLAIDPNYLPALDAMTMLSYQNMEYEKSLAYARHALSIDTYDPAGNYYYGLVNVQLGNVTDARDGFDIAALSTIYRGAAFTELSKLYIRQQDLSKAIHYATRALEVNTGNVDAYRLLSMIYRISGENEKAVASLQELEVLNPLDHFIRFEAYRREQTDESKVRFTSMIRNELPRESYLQLATWYYTVGQLKDALEVLRVAPPDPEVYYWMAFLKNKLNEADAMDYIAKANLLTPTFVFPFRNSSADMLRWVIQNSLDWKPKYYLALIYWNKNNAAAAKALLAQCGNPQFAPYYAVRASILNDNTYTADLKKAAELEPREWRFGKLLITRLIEDKNYQDALATARVYVARFPQDFRLSMLLAKALLMTNQYKACSDLLAKTTILPYEGATDGHQLYREAWVMQSIQQLAKKDYKGSLQSIGKARLWPENLGVGKPYDEDIDARLENYLEGICLEKNKNSTEAIRRWNDVVVFKSNHFSSATLFTALALAKLNRKAEGSELLASWIAHDPENQVAKWCRDVYDGNGSTFTDNAEHDQHFRIIRELVHIQN